MSRNTTVTSTTSVILIKDASIKNYIYLPQINTSNFTITIRDTTGSANIQTNPVIISTLSPAIFIDDTSSYYLNKPYGLVNIALRNSTVWQVLHTSGLEPANSAANSYTLSTNALYFGLESTNTKIVSTLYAENLATPNTIYLTSSLILANLSSIGYISIYSTLTTRGNVYINNNLFVSSISYFHSTVNISTLSTLSNVLYFQSSVAVGRDLFVGGSINIYSTLFSRSSVQLETVDIVQSTNNIILNITSSLTTAGLISTLGNFSTQFSTIVSDTVFFNENVSSQIIGGNFTTGTLIDYAHTNIRGDIITADMLNVRSSLFLNNNIYVNSNIYLFSSLDVGNSMDSYYLSTPSLSTNGSMTVHSTFIVLKQLIVSSNISTIYLEANANTSILGDLSVLNSISINKDFTISDNLFGLGDLNTSSIYVKENVGVGANFIANGSLYGNNITFNSNVSVQGNVNVQGFVTINSNLGVLENVYVSSNVYAMSGGFVSSFYGDRFILSSLEIIGSPGEISLEVSSLQTSSLYTSSSVFLQNYSRVSSVYASTIITSTVNAELIYTNNIITDKFLLGNIPQDFNYMFAINGNSYFTKGLSTISLYGSTIYSGLFSGAHIGDASQLSNVQVPFYYISTNNLIASSISVENIYTSAATISSFGVSTFLSVVSSILIPYLSINAIGFSSVSSVNNILALSQSSMVINRNLYFNASTKRIGLNVSSPRADLDVNGLLFASNIYYSSINNLQVNIIRGIYSSLNISTSLVGSTFGYGSTGTYVGQWYPGLGSGASNYPIRIWNTETIPNCNYGIASLSRGSTIALNNSLFINPSTGFVGVNTVQYTIGGNDAILLQPQYPLDVRGSLDGTIGFFSSINYTQQLTTTTLQFYNFIINGFSTPLLRDVGPVIRRIAPHNVCTLANSFVLDNIIEFDRRQYTGIGGQPTCALDVYFNTLFSSVTTNTLRADAVGINYREL